MNRGKAVVFARYESRLASLAGQVGDRNRQLLGIANLGIMADLPPERIETDLLAASGHPPLTLAEVRHAVRTAARDTRPVEEDSPAPRPAIARRPPPRPPLGERAASFVERTIEAGRDAPDLVPSSPVPIPDDPGGQTRAFLAALYAPGEFLFIGDPTARGTPGATVRTCREWIETGTGCAPLLIANPLTGLPGLTAEGRPSYRCAACVAVRRYALVEFDAMPLQDQYDFWRGAIRRRVLPVASVTFSGGKSLHGLIRLDAPDPEAWAASVATLLCAVANPRAPESRRADQACKNPDRMTRLPGAIRENGQAQALLWLARPEAWG
jgi:hypothetical protein